MENTKPIFIGIYAIKHLEAINHAKKEYDMAESRLIICKGEHLENPENLKNPEHLKEYENARSDLRFKWMRWYALCTSDSLNPED